MTALILSLPIWLFGFFSGIVFRINPFILIIVGIILFYTGIMPLAISFFLLKPLIAIFFAIFDLVAPQIDYFLLIFNILLYAVGFYVGYSFEKIYRNSSKI
jgi:hypothetical protein